MDRVVEKLKEGYGRDDVPVAVIYKATWEDEEIILGTLKDIEEKVNNAGITKTAQILVGDFIYGEYEDLNYMTHLFPMNIGRLPNENSLFVLF